MSEEKTEESWRRKLAQGGRVGKLNKDEIDRFLEEPNLARVASLDTKGWPYVVPCWYQWDGKSIWLVARAKSKWAKFLAEEPRCAVTIDESSAWSSSQITFSAQCEAVIVEQPNIGGRWVEIARTMALRYYGANGPSYLEPTMKWKRWLIRLDPVETLTWQGMAWPKTYLEGDAVAR